MASRGPARPANHPGPQTPPPAYGGAPNDYSDDEEGGSQEGEDDQDLSPINITIKCPLYVHGDSNVIQFDTAVAATKIAQGVVHSLKQMSMSGHGVPMIDEDGRPRPITVNAVAEVHVRGSRNVLGPNPRPKLAQLAPRPAPRPTPNNRQGPVVKHEREGPVIKREREGSAEAGAKRARVE